LHLYRWLERVVNSCVRNSCGLAADWHVYASRAMIRPTASPKLRSEPRGRPRSRRPAGSIGAPRTSVAPLVAVSSSADSNLAALSSTMVLVVWLVQLWRTCLKGPGSSKSVHLLRETGFVQVGALFRRARVRPS